MTASRAKHDSARTRRLAAAARAAWDSGQREQARESIALALPSARGELAAELRYLEGVIEFRTGSLRNAYQALLEGARLSEDPSSRLEMLQEAAEAHRLVEGNLVTGKVMLSP